MHDDNLIISKYRFCLAEYYPNILMSLYTYILPVLIFRSAFHNVKS